MDVEKFITDGYVLVRGAVDDGVAAACRDVLWSRLEAGGVRRDDPSTWTSPSVRIPCPDGEPFAAAASSAPLAAAYDVLIGPGRWTPPTRVGGDVPVRFRSEEWPEDTGYHIEGNWWGGEEYCTTLHSRDRGVTAFYLFSDIGPWDAPTRLVVGSHQYMAPVLARFGEDGVGGAEAVKHVQRSVLSRATADVTGRAGDVYLCHPFLIHTSTWPHRGTNPRMMAQPGIAAPAGFAVDGSDPAPVAQAIVRGLRSAPDAGPLPSEKGPRSRPYAV